MECNKFGDASAAKTATSMNFSALSKRETKVKALTAHFLASSMD
jgi:hypothetical protein